MDPRSKVALTGNVSRFAQAQYDQGAADAAMPIRYATLLLVPAPGLDSLLAEQQNPGSPNYHRWLTPEQFGDRFGLSAGDMAKVVGWLQSEGLTVNGVARGRHWVTFSGTAGSVGRALSTEFHRYRVNGETHFANTTSPSVPAALAGVVAAITGLNDFGLKPASVQPVTQPDFNASTGAHYIAPDDFATIYDLSPLYSAGIDGTGQKMAVVGGSDVNLADIQAFRKQFNLPTDNPRMLLYGPDPGIVATAMVEADLDLEWAGAVARNASIVYVYAQDVLVAEEYAVDQAVAPVVSMSFSGCELDDPPSLRVIAQQANAQGMTMIAASGDWGAAMCDASSPSQQASKGVSIGSPADFPEVTAIGGTTFAEGTGSYWSTKNGANLGSALSYIPEKVWDDAEDLGLGMEASGGGPSAVFPKPDWQTGAGVPNDNARDIPDISFAASPNHDGYLFVTSGGLYVVGGTSAGTPSFAGIATLLNQYLASKNPATPAGLGNVNPVLYRMAQSTTDVFHDVVSVSNNVPCQQATPGCVNGAIGFAAGAGYDLASGLGSVDASNLIHEWNSGTASVTTLTASPMNYSLTDSVQLTATVTGAAGAQPTGMVTFIANNNPLGTATLSPVNGTPTAAITASGLAIAGGNGNVTAMYSGDGVYESSGATAALALLVPVKASLVVPSVNPSPVAQGGNIWPFSITLSEKAGVATRLTKILENGQPQPLNVFPTTSIPANGSITTNVYEIGLTPPVNITFQFSGTDTSGSAWTQAITVPFVGPPAGPFVPSMTLNSLPTTVTQSANASCAWPQVLTLQETSGFFELLTTLAAGSQDLSGQIQSIFGTTRLAPYATLQGTLCATNVRAGSSKEFEITGVSEIGTETTSTVQVNYAAGSAPPAPVVPRVIEMLADPVSHLGAGTVNVSFPDAAAQWTVSIAGNAPWLKVSPLSGSGSAPLSVQASAAGLSNGVYDATLAIGAANGGVSLVRVVFVAGGSETTVIDGVSGAAAASVVFAPGMLASIYGSNLAPSAASAVYVPLPFHLNSVSATVNGISAPLTYVSPGQINLQIPYETGAGVAVLAVNNNGQIASYILQIAVTAPELFITPSGFLTPNASAHPGDTIFAYMTGEGDVSPFLATGSTPVSGTAATSLPVPRQPVTLKIGGIPAKVTFAGVTPGLVGVSQINFQIPSNVPAGVQPVVVTVGGASSSGASIRVVPEVLPPTGQ